MNVVKTGIYNLFTATSGSPAVHNSFYLGVGGRLYYDKAPQDVSFPYAVWGIITDTDSINFSSDKNEFVIQFDIFSDTATSEEIGNLQVYLKSLYHKSSPSITGYRVVHIRRTSSRGPFRDLDYEWWLYQARFILKIEPSS
jgi:hypothetical protein